MFIRNGSGALMLCYVAAGRVIGYYEPHNNSSDCAAATGRAPYASAQRAFRLRPSCA